MQQKATNLANDCSHGYWNGQASLQHFSRVFSADGSVFFSAINTAVNARGIRREIDFRTTHFLQQGVLERDRHVIKSDGTDLESQSRARIALAFWPNAR